MKPGSLLISQPFLGDPNFERTVVIICRDEPDEGSFGLVLNRATELTLGDVLELPLGDISPAAPLPLHVGGPVQPNTLHYLHQRADLPDATHLGDGTYWGGDFEVLLGLVQSGEVSADDLRLYAGYSGWGAGQLAGEIEQKTWIVHPPAAGKVFTLTTDAFWQAILREKGGRFKALSNYPIDPRLN